MLKRLIPERIDNTYLGYRLALWLFGVVVFIKSAIGLGTIVNGRNAAISADGIPLETFTAAGGQAFVAVFAAWGLGHLMLNLIGVLALVRYRAMVPLMFLVLLVENVARKVLFLFLPIPKVEGAPGFWVNLAFMLVMAVGLVLSLMEIRGAEHASQED